MHEALIAFGANTGDTLDMFHTVRWGLKESPTVVRLFSSELCETAPVGSGPMAGDYFNAVFRLTLDGNWTPESCLDFLLEMERTLGRTRQTHWESRCVDLDLLLFDDAVVHDFPRLILPHPMMPWRRFVLEPAVQVAPEWIHPTTGRTLAELLTALHRVAPRICRLSTALPAEWDSTDAFLNDTGADRPDVQAWAQAHHIPYLDARDVFRDGTPESDALAEVLRSAYSA